MARITVISALLLFLTGVAAYDIKFRKIENYTHFIIIAAAFFINSLTLAERIIGLVFCFTPFLAANILSDNKIGMGDVKLAGVFGFALGAYGGLTAAVAGLAVMLLTVGIYQKIRKQNRPVPLAPFLCGGFAVCLIFQIINS
jgi:prepilin signal peptidase PulO-like enzyme (type II secretory pathway)